MQRFSSTYWKIQDAYVAHRGKGKHYIVLQGGTYASKTWSANQFSFNIARTRNSTRVHTISESMPHMRISAMADFFKMLKDDNLYSESWHQKTLNRYDLPMTNSYIQFLGCDDPGKVTGSRCEVLYVNEANNVAYEVFKEANRRAEILTIIDYNPNKEFWIIDKMVEWGENCTFIKCNYMDALEFLPIGKRQEIEAYVGNERRIHIDAEWGSLEGRIYDFGILPDIPPEAELFAHGVDTGFSNDPTAVCALYRYNGGVICDELFYGAAMMPEDIWKGTKDKDGNVEFIGIKDEVDQSVDGYADPANPTYLEGFRRAGWRKLKPATKGKESVKAGIQLVQDNPLWFTARSVNFIKEARNYEWKLDAFGKPTNEPIGTFNHGMDALRYPLQTIFSKPKRTLYLAS